MILGACTLDYSSRTLLKEKVNKQDYEAIRSRIPALEMPPYEDRESWSGYGEMILDGEEMEFLTQRGLKLEVRRLKGVVQEHPKAVMGQPFPNLAIISVPNIALFEVRHVTWLENACTQELQRHLDQGWRILCVCPPNDQRRPDYILGRMEKP